MTGSSPNQPRGAKRRRASKPLMPWNLIGGLFGLYVVMGLLLSLPAPPYWTWIPAVVGTLMIIFGLNRPANVPGKRMDPMGLMTYLGGLLLVVAMAIATNHIGGRSLDGISFLVALFGLAAFTLLAVVLTAAATVLSAQTGETLMHSMDRGRSLSIVTSACLLGIGLGGVIGFSMLLLSQS